jgi:hypothetical protein
VENPDFPVENLLKTGGEMGRNRGENPQYI